LEYGIATPVNSKIVQIIKEIESGKRKIRLGNFEGVWKELYIIAISISGL
jgi:hypothetical protein